MWKQRIMLPSAILTFKFPTASNLHPSFLAKFSFRKLCATQVYQDMHWSRFHITSYSHGFRIMIPHSSDNMKRNLRLRL
uniref:Uncharacterized protein n=1 Tax=Rhizophora mucronata TaxID=61149 RepID=A0A2P2PP01_RHIMU